MGAVNVQVTGLRPFIAGSDEGFRFETDYLTADGLEFLSTVVGFVRAKKLHLLMYSAAKSHYYEQYEVTVERLLQSLRFAVICNLCKRFASEDGDGVLNITARCCLNHIRGAIVLASNCDVRVRSLVIWLLFRSCRNKCRVVKATLVHSCHQRVGRNIQEIAPDTFA